VGLPNVFHLIYTSFRIIVFERESPVTFNVGICLDVLLWDMISSSHYY